MKCFLTVKPGAKQDKAERAEGNHFKVWVKAPPSEGRANEAVIRVMAEHLRVPKSRLSIIRGENSKEKVLELH